MSVSPLCSPSAVPCQLSPTAPCCDSLKIDAVTAHSQRGGGQDMLHNPCGDAVTFNIGDMVTSIGLTSVMLNGKSGEIVRYGAASMRYGIKMASCGAIKAVKCCNLQHYSSDRATVGHCIMCGGHFFSTTSLPVVAPLTAHLQLSALLHPAVVIVSRPYRPRW